MFIVSLLVLCAELFPTIKCQASTTNVKAPHVRLEEVPKLISLPPTVKQSGAEINSGQTPQITTQNSELAYEEDSIGPTICEADPWRVQYFLHAPNPPGVRVPTEDI